MANTIDEFLKLFGGDSAADEQQAAQYHDRFVSTKHEDRLFDNGAYHDAVVEHLGSLPNAQFNQTAHNAVSQASPDQRQDLLSTLLGALGNSGSSGGGNGIAEIAKMLGLNTTDPRQMSNDDATKVFNYARTEQPDAMRQAVAEKPWFIQALGNPVVMSALTLAATKLLSSNQQRSS